MSRSQRLFLQRRPRTQPAHTFALAVALALLMTGCSGLFLPQSGPRKSTVLDTAEVRVQDQSPDGRVSYALISLSPSVVNRLQTEDQPSLFSALRTGGRAAQNRLGVGDVLSITIFESASGGLFIPQDAGARPGNFVQIPTQQIDQSGQISVPFGGRIRAAGFTPIGLQKAIESKLANRALEPQVVVSLVEQHANIVNVLGDVPNASRFAMDGGGDRVLGAVTRAGGSKFPAYESLVTIQRDGLADHAMLSEISETPSQNVELQPGDDVIVSHKQRFFLALGAIGQTQSLTALNRRIPFEDTRLTLNEAIAKGGGLQDDRANTQAVFLYRLVPQETIASILGPNTPADLPAQVPTIFLADFSKADMFFLANRVPMRNEDVIYVADAPAANLAKFISLVLPVAGTLGIINPYHISN